MSARAKRDLELKPQIERVFGENFGVYGAREAWRQMLREGFDVARCTVEPLISDLGLQGVIRGKPVSHDRPGQGHAVPAGPCQPGVPRAGAEQALGLGLRLRLDLSGFVYVAFVIDAYARRIVGWRVSPAAHASFVLDALEQALHERRPVHRAGLAYVSIRYTERLAEAGIEPSVGSVASRRPKPRSAIMRCWTSQPSWRDSNQTACGEPGAVRFGDLNAKTPLRCEAGFC